MISVSLTALSFSMARPCAGSSRPALAPEGGPHGFESVGEKWVYEERRGRLSCCLKGGLTSKLSAVTDAKGRPLEFFRATGGISD